MTQIVGLLVGAAVASCLLTWATRRYALKHELLDVPNDRSSHTVPTPRGGGVAIALTFLVGLVCLHFANLLPQDWVIAAAGSGVMAATVGAADDHRSVPAQWRLLVHFAAAIWVLYWLGGVSAVPLTGTADIAPGLLLDVAAVLALVWLLNLYNFMDGIDGIAGFEAVTVCAGGAIVCIYTVPDSIFWVMPALLGASVVGFLVWNFPSARVFMGDAGSGFVGMAVGSLAITAASEHGPLLWSWLILLGVFVVDATITLARRLLGNRKIFDAHRSHAYQHASRRFGSHRIVTVAVALINIVWLLPWAFVVAAGVVNGAFGMLLSYLPLVWLAVFLGAGREKG